MMIYKNNREEIDDIPFTSAVPITEKVVRWELIKRGIPDDNLEIQPQVQGCPFTKPQTHKADFLLKSSKGEKLYIEVKGQMTYYEVNKLRFLLENNTNKFYILQLTEMDWIKNISENQELSNAEKRRRVLNTIGSALLNNIQVR